MISPYFSYTFNGLIFKILPDNVLPLLAVEVRHLQDKEVSFAIINYLKGELLFEGLGLEETWWVGIAGLSNGNLFFHHFADKEYPIPKALIAADITKQALIWEKEDTYLEEITTNGIYVSYIESGEKKYNLLHPTTGEPVKEIYSLADKGGSSIITNLQSIFPSQYEADSPHFTTVSQFLSQKFGIDPIYQIDYVEFENKIMIAYLVEHQKKLLIINTKGEVLFHQSILSGTSGLGTESFFIIAHCLVCISERSQVLLFNL